LTDPVFGVVGRYDSPGDGDADTRSVTTLVPLRNWVN
jgi:hypothetical protein